jgi:hypothetical protein
LIGFGGFLIIFGILAKRTFGVTIVPRGANAAGFGATIGPKAPGRMGTVWPDNGLNDGRLGIRGSSF